METLHAVIPAGGAGTRLWPLSRQTKPKFLLDLLGSGHTLLQETVLRLLPVSQSITVVTGVVHVAQVEEQIRGLRKRGKIPARFPIQVIAEPSGRDSMPAIGLAAYLLRKQHGGDAVIGSFAADHDIRLPEAFHSSVRAAIGAAKMGYISTIGLEPDGPSTAYGYIARSDKMVAPGVYKVTSFVEKPDGETAAKYVQNGYLWNAGMFVMKGETLTSILGALHPAMANTFEQIAANWGDPKFQQDEFDELWDQLPKIAIDFAIAEPAAERGKVAVSKMSEKAGWSDLGDFVALQDSSWSHVNPTDTNSLATARENQLGTDVLSFDSQGAIVRATTKKKIVLLGVPNVVVVDTPDALLVTARDKVQEIKKVPAALKTEGRSDLV